MPRSYYFLSYIHLRSQLPTDLSHEDIDLQYVVPTGNFWDVLAGYYAKKMRLPIGKLVIATNEMIYWQGFGKTAGMRVDSTAGVVGNVTGL